MTDLYIQKVLDGDTNAFRFIIKNYKDHAYSLAMSVVKDEFVAQEVVQVSFIRAYTKLDTFKGKSKFATWLYRIVINEAFKVLKKQEKEPVVSPGNLSKDVSSKVDDITLKTEKDNQRYYINEALKKLSSKNSLALRLFYLEECSIKEMIQITGWTNSNTKVILHRARTSMKRLLTELYNLDKEELY